jgi:hypothetical protein
MAETPSRARIVSAIISAGVRSGSCLEAYTKKAQTEDAKMAGRVVGLPWR